MFVLLLVAANSTSPRVEEYVAMPGATKVPRVNMTAQRRLRALPARMPKARAVATEALSLGHFCRQLSPDSLDCHYKWHSCHSWHRYCLRKLAASFSAMMIWP